MDSSSTLLTKRNIIFVLLLLILVVSIPLAVRLAQQQTQLRSKAAGEASIVFKDPAGKSGVVKEDPAGSGNFITTEPSIQIQVTSPFGATSSASQ